MIARTLVAVAPFLFTVAAAGLAGRFARRPRRDEGRDGAAVAVLLIAAIAAAWLGPWPRHPAEATGQGGVLIDAHAGTLLRVTALALGLWAFGFEVPALFGARRRQQRAGAAAVASAGPRPEGGERSASWMALATPGPLWAFSGAFLACVADAWWVALLAVECVAAGVAMLSPPGTAADAGAPSNAGGAECCALPIRRAQAFGTLVLLFGFAMLYALSGTAAFSVQPWALARAAGQSLAAAPAARPLAVCGLVGVLVGLGVKLGCPPFHGVVTPPRSGPVRDRQLIVGALPLITAAALIPRLANGVELVTGIAAATLFATLALFCFLVPTCRACLCRDAGEQWRYFLLAHWGCVFAAAYAGTAAEPGAAQPVPAAGKPADGGPAASLVDPGEVPGRRWVFTPQRPVVAQAVPVAERTANAPVAVTLYVAADDFGPPAIANLAMLNLVLATALFATFAHQLRRRSRVPAFVGGSVLSAEAVAGAGRSDVWMAVAAVAAWTTLAGLPPALGAWPRTLQWLQLLNAAQESDYSGIPAPAPLSLLLALAAVVHGAVLLFLAARWVFVIVVSLATPPVQAQASPAFRFVTGGIAAFILVAGVCLPALGPFLRLW